MSQLLLEFFSEEIPARMQKGAMETLATLFCHHMNQSGIEVDIRYLKTYVTPRRLVLYVENLPEFQPDQTTERRGPRIDAPEAAHQGFVTSTGLALTECEIRDTAKGKFYFAVSKIQGQALKTLLPDLVRRLVAEFTWPKSMRWAGSSRTWVRPLHSGVCLFNGAVVPFDIMMGNEHDPDTPRVAFKDISIGHRFLSPKPFQVKNFQQYQDTLRANYVILDPKERRQTIQQQANDLAQEVGCWVLEDERLLDEIVGLVEWPVLYLGQIDDQFRRLPRDVLITALRVHQRYLVLEHPQDGLSHFIIVANTTAVDAGQTTIQGNQRVLKARLSDANFFMHQDQRKTLRQHANQLNQLIFHQDLGTLMHKTQRLQQLAHELAPTFGLDVQKAVDTASLLKADLVTEIVGEFPELQGIMGHHYARAEGYDNEIATAIGQQYFLKSQTQPDHLLTPLGRLMAFVDRFDTLIGFLTIGIKPTGSKDPYALRRAALVIIDLLENYDICLDLNHLIACVHGSLEEIVSNSKFQSLVQVQQQFQDFFSERLKIYWQKQGLSYDVIDAVLKNDSLSSLYHLKKKCCSLQTYFKDQNQQGSLWLEGYRRACHILEIEERKDQKIYQSCDLDPELFKESEEQTLYLALKNFESFCQKFDQTKDFDQILTALSNLCPVINAYFDKIMINTSEINLRHNRLNTLALFRSLVHEIADFGKIEQK